MTTFYLPDVGEGLTEAEIVAWHVSVGDHVVADQPLVSVETDKAVVEIPSPRSGHIGALHGGPGDIVLVGDALVDFTDEAAPDAGAIVGELRSEIPPHAEAHATPHEPTGTGTGAPSAPSRTDRPRATPAVRSLAAELGVDLDTLEPTGPGGTITGDDVRAATGSAGVTADDVVPLRGVRRSMDANMSRAHSEVVPATVMDEADIGDWADGTDTTLRLMRAIAVAAEAEPALNATYLGRDRGRRLNDHVDVGIAVDTEDGLFVPVLRDVANRTPDDLRRGLDAMRADITGRTVAPEHLRGATISLSNFGVFGGRHAALVVVPPQVAIIGAGRALDAVVARDGLAVVRRVLPVSLTFDHRVVMGGEAARFLRALRDDLERAQ